MRSLAILLLAGCGSTATHDPVAPTGPVKPAGGRTYTSELSPALKPLAWWLGDWASAATDEHWVAASGAMYGVAFDHKGGFEVMIVDDGDGPGKPDGVLRFIAMPGAHASTEFKQQALGANTVSFANPAHDYPTQIRYASAGGGLAAMVGDGTRSESFAWKKTVAEPAIVLEKADVAFSNDTNARGVDGWVAAFAPDGGMLRRGKRVEGAAIREVMAPLLASGKLTWGPIASGIDKASGAIGFTVGKAEFVGDKPEDNWKSTYITIWRKQPDGSWKVAFDTGRPVNE